MTPNNTNTAQLWRVLVVAVVALAVVGAAAPGLAVAQSDNPPQTPHRYFGQVTDGSGGGVADATVTVTYDGDEIANTTTNADGDYGLDITDERLSNGDTVTVSVSDQSQDESWESGSSTEVSFQIDTGDDGSDGDDSSDGDGGDDGSNGSDGSDGSNGSDGSDGSDGGTGGDGGAGDGDDTDGDDGDDTDGTGGDDTDSDDTNGDDTDDTDGDDTDGDDTTDDGIPGFGTVVALVALIAAALLATRADN